MNNLYNILAKSPKNGGTPLIHHIEHTIDAIEKIATHLNFDVELARKGAILHDIGKVHPAFQKKIRNTDTDIITFLTEIPHRHEISSLLFLSLVPKQEWGVITDMIIGHHKSIAHDSSNRGFLDLLNNEGKERVLNAHLGNWEDWSKDALKIIALFGFKTHIISIKEAEKTFEELIRYCRSKGAGWSRWRGLLIAADHFASAMSVSTKNQVKKTFDIPDLSFYKQNERINKFYPLSQISTNDPRPHTIVVAPTGSGKTDFLLRRCKDRVFYTLPFQASINAMYERIKTETKIPDGNIRMLHAASRVLVKKSNKQEEYEERALQPLVGSSIKILTPHQIAAIIFGTRGFEAINLDMEGSDVILDEIHSYSSISRSMVIEIVKVLRLLNCHIHIGTATMPKVLLQEILKILGGEENTYYVKMPEDELDEFDRHIIYKNDSFENTLSIIDKALQENKKILIIANRVGSAQERYDLVRHNYPNIPKLLIHSRFRRRDRANLEKKLMKEFNVSEGACIVVATQVVEVSMDIDFDLMITDCAPLDSLIQRFGRVNRKRSEETIGKLKAVYVISPPQNQKDVKPYGLQETMESYKQLSHGEILHEKALQKKIDTVFPNIEIFTIDVHLAYKNGRFIQKELCHKPKSIILDALEIESATCIRQSDRDGYLAAKFDDRINFELPIPWKITQRKNFRNYGRLEIGTYPFVIDDSLYDFERGLRLSIPVNLN